MATRRSVTPRLTYVLDDCQSVGQLDVDLRRIGCDVLACMGRKHLRGPRGTGFHYIGRRLADQIDPPFIDLHAAKWTEDRDYEIARGARRFENYESTVAGRIGLARAISYARDIGLCEIQARVGDLAATLRAALSELPGVSVHDLGGRERGIVTFAIEGVDQFAFLDAAFAKNVSTSVSVVEHVRRDLGQHHSGSPIRVTLHYFNTETEIKRFVELVAELRTTLWEIKRTYPSPSNAKGSPPQKNCHPKLFA